MATTNGRRTTGSGRKANHAGMVAETMLAAVLRANELLFDRQVVVGRTIYGTKCTVDFVIRNLAMFPNGLIVESKWQASDGTTDEKFPYLLSNIQEHYPLPAIVIVMGDGCRPGAIEWLRGHCDGRHLVAVHDVVGFIKWANQADRL